MPNHKSSENIYSEKMLFGGSVRYDVANRFYNAD
jgi:hypothetical protein